MCTLSVVDKIIKLSPNFTESCKKREGEKMYIDR